MNTEMLTETERRRCEVKLHRLLSWVGTEIPTEIHLGCGDIPLRDTIYNFLVKDRLTEEDEGQIHRLLQNLEERELMDEKKLKYAPLTKKEAEGLCLELAGLLRAIMDLRDVEAPRQQRSLKKRGKHHKVEDVKRWTSYLKELKE
ncbi:hypothetical protein DRN70_02630 [Methanosarcinales archaeon]|nr:MAG: hypothetical protein DRN70_02630 [Methanosarcinales archaeon]